MKISQIDEYSPHDIAFIDKMIRISRSTVRETRTRIRRIGSIVSHDEIFSFWDFVDVFFLVGIVGDVGRNVGVEVFLVQFFEFCFV